jgi:hypothetical protein
VRYLILSEVDQQRYGCPDKLPFDMARITNNEVRALFTLGFKSLNQIVKLLAEGLDDINDQVLAALDAVVWLALRRSGVHVDIRELEYDFNGLAWFDDEADVEPIVDLTADPGKAEASKRSSPRKATGSTTSRRKSTRTGSRS